jgi:hypothetical protein
MMVGSIYAPGSWAAGCNTIHVPTEIERVLETKFPGWEKVTPQRLSSPDDRQIWNDQSRDECPGLIVGHFTGAGIEYVINLVRGLDKTLEQQLILLRISGAAVKTVILDPPSHVGAVWVIRKLPPGLYRSVETGRSVRSRFDVIGFSQIEAGAVIYYWDGKRFRDIVTSI